MRDKNPLALDEWMAQGGPSVYTPTSLKQETCETGLL